MTDSTQLFISLSVEGGDDAELEELTRQLKSEIAELQVNSIEDASQGSAPEGTKSAADWASLGNFAVTLAPIIIPPLFELLKSWVDRKPSAPVTIKVKTGKNKTAQIEYDPTKTSAEELKALVRTLGQTIK